MGLYVYVYDGATGNPITNATFWAYAFSNYGNGLYYYWAPYNTTIYVIAPGKQALWFDTNDYYVFYAYLANTPPPHNSHSNGWT